MNVECAVCETPLAASEAWTTAGEEEEPIFFCRERCYREFELDPERYLSPKEEPLPISG